MAGAAFPPGIRIFDRSAVNADLAAMSPPTGFAYRVAVLLPSMRISGPVYRIMTMSLPITHP
jgi:hypothetical protein